MTRLSNHELVPLSFQDISELYLLDPIKPVILIPK